MRLCVILVLHYQIFQEWSLFLGTLSICGVLFKVFVVYPAWFLLSRLFDFNYKDHFIIMWIF